MTSDAEDKARELGRITTKLEYLEKTMDGISTKIDKGFSGLECRQNTEQIKEVFGWYTEHKDNIKTAKHGAMKTIVTSVVTAILTALGFKLS